MRAQLVALTEPFVKDEGGRQLTAEEFIIYCARVSNPSNQLNVETAPKLLNYLIKQGHWSPFETVNVTFELQTSRAIAAQILRHRSFTFQEFSQRYAVVTSGQEPVELRLKGDTNRQSSVVAPPEHPIHYMDAVVERHMQQSQELYDTLVAGGCAPESARFVLPLATKTTLYMTGNVRSWIFYLAQRCDAHAQKEHRELALLIRAQLTLKFPTLAEALGWTLPE